MAENEKAAAHGNHRKHQQYQRIISNDAQQSVWRGGKSIISSENKAAA